jgi:hypothetical protein
MISFKDYQKPDGEIDWNAYRAAKIENGQQCYRCESFLIPARGYRALCSSCNTLATDPRAVTHSRLIRCPKCGEQSDAEHRWESGIHGDGEHAIGCYECEHEFTVKTFVSYLFESPARLPEETEPEEEDEG